MKKQLKPHKEFKDLVHSDLQSLRSTEKHELVEKREREQLNLFIDFVS